MANINSDYLVTLDIKNATVFNRYDLEFFVTDVNTCNIFVNLGVEEGTIVLEGTTLDAYYGEHYLINENLINVKNNSER